MKYRKKPIVIDAIRVETVQQLWPVRSSGLPAWLLEALDFGIITLMEDHCHIRTLEGVMRGGSEDWILRGVKGELYPCKKDIFEATYEKAET